MAVFNSNNVLKSVYDDDGSRIEISPQTEAALFEQFLIDEFVYDLSPEERTAFLESELCEQLITEGKMRKNTVVFLSGKDDLARRTKMSAIQLAKEKNDPLVEKLRLNRIKERNLVAQIMARYGSKATKVAKSSQKDWIKNRMPSNFGKFGGDARLSSTPTANAGSKGPKKHSDGLVW